MCPPTKKKWVCSKGHWKWVSESPCAATEPHGYKYQRAQQDFSRRFQTNFTITSLWFSQNPNMLHKRIKSSTAHEKLMQHIKNINPKYGFYSGRNSSIGDVRDSFPSLVLNSHTVTADLEKHSSSLGVNSHKRESLLPRTSVKWTLQLPLTNISHTERWKSNWRAGPYTLNQPFP